MVWNKGYFDKKGNQLSANDDNQEVYNGYGIKIGYFKDGIVRDNNGNKLTLCNYEQKINPSDYDCIRNFLRMCGFNYWL
jgi:hypothetical protein